MSASETSRSDAPPPPWAARTDTRLHELYPTSSPNVFAIGDVRAGSLKRVGAAVGEGAAVVSQLHAVLHT
jgi:thioredoxin reductase (NADPH)